MREQLDRLAAAAWPALEQVEVDGWLLRAAVSDTGVAVTRRANSALAMSWDGVNLETSLLAVRDFYAARNLPPTVLVSDPALATALDKRGWTAHTPTLCLTGPLPTGPVTGLTLTPAPSEPWLACWWAVDGRGNGPELDVSRNCLARIDSPAVYASVVVDGRTLAAGRAVAQDGWLGIFSMAVLPGCRRQGLARRVLAALGGWGREQGAQGAYLLIDATNAAARALYDDSGFCVAHEYHYRRLQ